MTMIGGEGNGLVERNPELGNAGLDGEDDGLFLNTGGEANADTGEVGEDPGLFLSIGEAVIAGGEELAGARGAGMVGGSGSPSSCATRGAITSPVPVTKRRTLHRAANVAGRTSVLSSSHTALGADESWEKEMMFFALKKLAMRAGSSSLWVCCTAAVTRARIGERMSIVSRRERELH